MSQMVLSPEPAVALFTGERLLVLVYQVVGFELVRVGEAGIANLTAVGFLSRVDPQMPSQVGHLHKQPVTVGATVGLFPCV